MVKPNTTPCQSTAPHEPHPHMVEGIDLTLFCAGQPRPAKRLDDVLREAFFAGFHVGRPGSTIADTREARAAYDEWRERQLP